MKIGDADCYGDVIHGTYTGDDINLKGKTALLRAVRFRGDLVAAQFDDRSTGKGFGWHKFSKQEFIPDDRSTALGKSLSGSLS